MQQQSFSPQILKDKILVKLFIIYHKYVVIKAFVFMLTKDGLCFESVAVH